MITYFIFKVLGEEEDDVYETNEFLAKDDFRVVSITNGLPEKLVKLSSISIKKIDENATAPSLSKTVIQPTATITAIKSTAAATTTRVTRQTRQSKNNEEEIKKLLHEPHVNLTVFLNGSGKGKALPFTGMKQIDIMTMIIKTTKNLVENSKKLVQPKFVK